MKFEYLIKIQITEYRGRYIWICMEPHPPSSLYINLYTFQKFEYDSESMKGKQMKQAKRVLMSMHDTPTPHIHTDYAYTKPIHIHIQI